MSNPFEIEKSIGNQRKSIANRENLLEIQKSRDKSNRILEILHESTEIRYFEISYAKSALLWTPRWIQSSFACLRRVLGKL